MFIGREHELSTLKRLYESDGFQFPVVYGRRRVGKTTLISRFASGKPTIFFTAIENDRQINLRNLSNAIAQFEHPDRDPKLAAVYTDFQQAFEVIFALAQEERIVFVIDEFPYLAKADSSVSSILQSLIDSNHDNSKLFLVLCGSSLSFMKEQVLGEKSPLYGRRTAQIELKPFDFFDSTRFFPDSNPFDVAAIYGMVGGIPLYLLQFQGGGSLQELTERALLDPNSILYEEPGNLLMQEVVKASRYNAVIDAIAGGRTQSNEIASAVGISSAEVTYYLKELERNGLVIREKPLLGKERRPLYRLSDNLFRFWFRFVLPYTSSIERNMPGRAWNAIKNALSEYMGPVFEDICRQWLWRQADKGAISEKFDVLGRWWGNDPRLKQEAEIDIVGAVDHEVVLTAECKWRNEAFPASELEKLRLRTDLIGKADDAQLYAFSKTGFSDACIELASQNGNAHLVSFAEMV